MLGEIPDPATKIIRNNAARQHGAAESASRHSIQYSSRGASYSADTQHLWRLLTSSSCLALASLALDERGDGFGGVHLCMHKGTIELVFSQVTCSMDSKVSVTGKTTIVTHLLLARYR